ncbi:MAG: arylsulfatase, partial [Acidimicrobiia bacterium]|nr:arylsulfatase [Acidimicrobiia bacterium]
MRDPATPPTMAQLPRSAAEPPFRAGAPNVMVVVFDDLGFAQLGGYGSDLMTPNIDRIAAGGLRFTNFHTTAVCSPTRACLMTGRNHHRVGMGMLPDLPTNFPAYSGQFPRSAGTIAQVLRAQGYATFCVGKWHLVPRDQRVTGPYDMWPTGLGFDRYYGFLNGETNQWTPNLVRDTNHVEPPRTPDDGYHLDADLADNAISYLRELRLSHPERPFLLWYASAAPHAPHQAPDEWIERFRGRFDDGWDAWREATLERQAAHGIVPADTPLSERPPWVEEWSTIDAPRQRLYARMMEVCAAFIAHADHQLGRVLDHLEATGELDNTIIVFVSDNGASGEGGPNGTYNQLGHYVSDEPDDIADELAHFDDLGGIRSSGHYPWGWALAGNTPFRRWKRYTFEGGVRDPFVITGPGVDDPGGVRTQYCHAVDVLPTVLDLCGVAVPAEIAGIEQMSLDGVSLVPVIDDAAAPEARTSQYYECWGSRAMYHEGWKAVTDHVNQLTAAERDQITGSHDFATDTWALFDTRTDPTESRDLAAEEPERLTDLVQRWFAEAERNQVFPLDDGAVNRITHMHVPWTAARASFVFAPGDKIHEVAGPNIAGGFRMVATFDEAVPQSGHSVLCEQGDWISGWAWYLVEGEARWCIADKTGAHRVQAPIPPSTKVLAAEGIIGTGGLAVVLTADGVEITRRALGVHPPLAWAPDGAFLTIGYGRPFPVSDDYQPPAPAPASLLDVSIR